MMHHPLFVLATLSFTIVLAEWLNQKTFLRHLGTSLLVILFGATWANLGLIPSASDQATLYDGIFTYVAPISIFYLLLGVNIAHLKKAGLPMLIIFFVGSIATTIGAIVAAKLVGGVDVFGKNHQAVAGMLTGTYTGGSVNFNAIALHYEMTKEGNVYAGMVAVDNILTALWMILSLLLPKLFQQWFPRKVEVQEPYVVTDSEMKDDEETVNPLQLGSLIGLGVLTLWGSDLLAEQLQTIGINMPAILILTTIALIFAQFPFIQKIKGAKLLGMFLIHLFLVVIGAFCELAALTKIGSLVGVLFLFMGIIILVHGSLIYLIGGLFKQDWALISIASQANIGGPSTAMALAKSFDRNELILPSILVGSLGAGVGTYLGFFVAEIALA